MATMRMYCPSLKENVEATVTDGKRVRSKGGSFRTVIYGEYEGRKCLPKTVKADVFAQYGFEAETISKDMTFNIDIEDATIENEEELEERGYSQDEIESMREEITSRTLEHEKDRILEDIKSNHLDSIGGDTYYIEDEYGVYLRSRDRMVDDVEASIDYEVDAGGWSAETFEAEDDWQTNDEFWEMLAREYGELFDEDGVIQMTNSELRKIAKEKGFDAEDDYEDCQACFTTVKKGKLNDVQAGLICDTCHDMNKYDRPYSAEAVSIGNVEGDGLLAVMDGVGEHKGFIELEDDDDEDSVEIGISDEEMNEIAEIKLGAEPMIPTEKMIKKYLKECVEEADINEMTEETLDGDELEMLDEAFENNDDDEIEKWVKIAKKRYLEQCRENMDLNYVIEAYGSETFEGEGEYHLNGEGCEYCSEERELNAEGYCSECVSYAENYSSESILNPSKMSKDGKLALGLTAIGIGIAMFKADKIAEWFNKR